MVDTGVDYTHPDILSNLWTNPDESANGKDNDGNGELQHPWMSGCMNMLMHVAASWHDRMLNNPFIYYSATQPSTLACTEYMNFSAAHRNVFCRS